MSPPPFPGLATLARGRRFGRGILIGYGLVAENIIILVYATPDGQRYYRKKRALTSSTDVRETTAAVDVSPDNLGTVEDDEERERYATEAARMAEEHDPDEAV